MPACFSCFSTVVLLKAIALSCLFLQAPQSHSLPQVRWPHPYLPTISQSLCGIPWGGPFLGNLAGVIISLGGPFLCPGCVGWGKGWGFSSAEDLQRWRRQRAPRCAMGCGQVARKERRVFRCLSSLLSSSQRQEHQGSEGSQALRSPRLSGGRKGPDGFVSVPGRMQTHSFSCIRNMQMGAGELAPWVKCWAVQARGPSKVPTLGTRVKIRHRGM